MPSVKATAGVGCGLSSVSVTSTSPGTGTLNGWESVPEVVKFPVNVSVTVGGANNDGCVGKVVPVFVDEQPLARAPIASSAETLLNIGSMLLDGPDAPQPTGLRQWKRFSVGEARASYPGREIADSQAGNQHGRSGRGHRRRCGRHLRLHVNRHNIDGAVSGQMSNQRDERALGVYGEWRNRHGHHRGGA